MNSIAQGILGEAPDDQMVAELAHASIEEQRALLDHPNRDVRWFVIVHAPTTAGLRAGELLEHAFLHDRDGDNRIDALNLLAEVDRPRAQRHLGRIRRKLKSGDWAAAMRAAFTLLRLRDNDSLPYVEAAVTHWAGDGVGAAAEIVADGLRGADDKIADELLSHSHIRTPWLAEAAAIIGTPQMKAALERAARELPDEECRGDCARALAKARGG